MACGPIKFEFGVDWTRPSDGFIYPVETCSTAQYKFTPFSKSKLVSAKDAIALNRGRELPKDYWNILP